MGVEASAWLRAAASHPDGSAQLRCVGKPQECGLSFEFARPPPTEGRRCECVFRIPEHGTVQVEAVVYWWRLFLLPPSDAAMPTPHEDTVAYSERTTSAIGQPTAVYSTEPTDDWIPREHWWQACCVLPSPIALIGEEPQQELRLVAAHNDVTVWFEQAADQAHDATADRKHQKQRFRFDSVAASEAPEVVDGQWRCSCGVHTEWSAQRLVQLADAPRQESFRAALHSTLADCASSRLAAGEAQPVVLAFGVWIGVAAARALCSLQLVSGPDALRVVVIEGSSAARRLARAVLAAQQPPLPPGLVVILDPDWSVLNTGGASASVAIILQKLFQ